MVPRPELTRCSAVAVPGAVTVPTGTGGRSRLCRSLVITLLAAGCVGKDDTQKLTEAFQRGVSRPDEVPVMINKDLPFRYPAALYAKKVQGNVALRLFIDRNGRVHPESTSVYESSGHPSLDSAAVRGSEALRFVPAKTRGEPRPVSILFPVYFRHPQGAPFPSDTIPPVAPGQK
ncbi:MAG: hypothetical protein NVS4B3_09810 [Gemmatimonadaceae bacterium]